MIRSVCLLLLLSFATLAQIRTQFSDPDRPGTIRIDLLSGGLTITGTNEKEIIIESPGRNRQNAERGMRRISKTESDIEIREENNVLRINGSGVENQKLVLQVPRRTSIIARNVNNGTILIENLEGEIEAQNVNGSIRLVRISGSAIANTVNGKIETEILRVTAGKPMSFTTLNGSIDLTFPSDMKANLRMKADNGDIYTDFDLLVRGNNNRSQHNRNSVEGTVNGGGSQIQIHTVNGKIIVRKK